MNLWGPRKLKSFLYFAILRAYWCKTRDKRYTFYCFGVVFRKGLLVCVYFGLGKGLLGWHGGTVPTAVGGHFEIWDVPNTTKNSLHWLFDTLSRLFRIAVNTAVNSLSWLFPSFSLLLSRG